MISLKGTKIKVCDYKIIASNDEYEGAHYATSDNKDEIVASYEGAGFSVDVEHLDVSAELFLDGAECPDLQTAHEWLALGYIPKTQEEILQETVDMLVLSMLEG